MYNNLSTEPKEHFSICRLPHKSTLQKNPANHRRLAAALSHQASFAMVSPKNPASAAAANPANATRRPGFGKESSEKPAASSRPSFSTHPSDQSEARIGGTGGNGSFKCKFKFNTRHFGIWVRTHPNFKRKFKFNAQKFGIWVRTHPNFKRNFKSIEVGIWFRTHPKCNGLETGEHPSFDLSAEGLPGLDEAITSGDTSTDNPPDTTIDDGDVVMVDG
uniref:Uncharacterized protein n=1 Tax=Globisporangium ultimum (strain ATCC 200006 / CBS 805.95 / DAOM BR144) TaxID=431595 RepID=K3XDE5_GLOUD